MVKLKVTDFDTLFYYIIKVGARYPEYDCPYPCGIWFLKRDELTQPIIYATRNDQYCRHLCFTLTGGPLKAWGQYPKGYKDPEITSDFFREWLKVAKPYEFMKIIRKG